MNTKQTKLFREIAVAVVALSNCKESGNTEWAEKWSDRLEAFEDLLPSGSGFDNGTKIDLDRTQANKIVLTTAFHHMNESGMYDGWTEHTVTVRPTFQLHEFELTISGRNRNDIKDYIYDVFASTLGQTVEITADNEVKEVR